MKPTARPTQRKPKRIKARRGYLGECYDHPAGGTTTTLHSEQRNVMPPVAVIDVSNPQALIEQVARVISESIFKETSNLFGEEAPDCTEGAIAVLSSLDLITRKRTLPKPGAKSRGRGKSKQ